MKKAAILLLITVSLAGLVFAQADEPPDPEPAAEPEQEKEDKEEEEQQVGTGKLDIIFAIDASRSVGWTDPADFRKALVAALIDITQNQGGGRIAAVQFGGWKETQDAGATVFKLKEIPNDPQLRDVLITGIKNAVRENIRSSGKATDFNFAFEKAIQEVLDERKKKGSENRIWLILISDGSMEVVEGNHVEERYLSELQSEGKRINRHNLNEAARRMFSKNILPTIAANRDMYVTCINLGTEKSDILQEISQLPNANLLRTSDNNLKDVFVSAFSQLPAVFPDCGIPKGFGYIKSEILPASSCSYAFHVYEGASTTYLLVLCGSREFSLDIKDESNTSIKEKQNHVFLHGKGESYRFIAIKNEPPGEYSLEITSSSDSPVVMEFLEYADFGLDAYIGTADLGNEFLPDETLRFEVGLKHVQTDTFINDPALVSQSEVLIKVRDVEGNVTESIATFTEPSEAKTLVEFKLPKDAPGGEYEITVSIGAIKNTVLGGYAFVSKQVSASFSVLSPVVELHIEPEEAFVGQPVHVVGIVTKGSLTEKQKQEGIITRIVHTDSGAEKELNLAWKDNQLAGTVAFSVKGEWKLQKSSLGTGQLKPVEPEKIKVKPRAIRVFQVGRDGKRVPVDSLKLKGKIGESVMANLLVEADLGPGETGKIGHGFIKAVEDADVSLTLVKTEITKDKPFVLLDMRLKMGDWPEKVEVGDIEVIAYLPGEITLKKKIAVSTELPPKPFPWLYAAIAGAAALLLILLLLIIFSGPTFTEQQLFIVGGSGHHVKEWKTGRKSALGTAEVPGTLQFKLKGSKAKPGCLVIPGKNTRIFVNNVECTYWADVHHGDYIEVFPVKDEFSYKYRYFEKAPTAGELQAAVDVTEEIGEGVLLGEDEFILADEDDLGAAPGDATQALLEQARHLKEREKTEAPGVETAGILTTSTGSERSAEEALDKLFSEEGPESMPTEILREAAHTPAEQDFTEAIPSMPEEATEAIMSEFYEETEEVEPTQVIESKEDSFFEEITSQDTGLVPDLPLSEDESEVTQAIGEEGFVEAEVSEPTEVIGTEDDFAGAMLTEPTEEIAEEVPVEELTDLVEERLEMSEFVEEDEQAKEELGEDTGTNLAEELDRTFDEILGEEEKGKEDL